MLKNIKRIFICLFAFFVTFLLGFVGSNTYNYYNSSYEIKFSVNEKIDYLKLEDKDYLLTIVNSAEKYKEIDVNKMLKNDDINIEKKGDSYTITTGFQYYKEFFISSSKTKGTRVKQFFKDAINGLVSDKTIVNYEYENVYIVKDQVNNYMVGLITSVVGFSISIGYLIINKDRKIVEYDNVNIYKTPFHKSYWKGSMTFLDTTKKIVTIAMLFGLMMVCKMFALPSGFSNLGLSLTYLFFALICLIYGPIAGFTIGFFSDVLGYFLFDRTGVVFYFGYTLQSMMAGFVYGLFLYKSRITFTKCFFARLIINLVLNVVWGSICFGDVMNYDSETTKMYALIIELPKNLIYLVPQAILLFIFLKFVSPILYRSKFIGKNIYENIGII